MNDNKHMKVITIDDAIMDLYNFSNIVREGLSEQNTKIIEDMNGNRIALKYNGTAIENIYLCTNDNMYKPMIIGTDTHDKNVLSIFTHFYGCRLDNTSMRTADDCDRSFDNIRCLFVGENRAKYYTDEAPDKNEPCAILTTIYNSWSDAMSDMYEFKSELSEHLFIEPEMRIRK